jgi:hypothetical protein
MVNASVVFPQQLKPSFIPHDVRRGLKPRPFKTEAKTEFFRNQPRRLAVFQSTTKNL